MADKPPSPELLDLVTRQAIEGFDRTTGVGPIPSDLPANVQAYMRSTPSYAEDRTYARLPPAVADLFDQERGARAAQVEGNVQGAGREDELLRQLFGMRDWPNVPPLNDMGNEQNSWRVSMTAPGGAAPVPSGPQSFAAQVPPQSVSSFNQAVQQLGLTPQEQNLYQHHLSNLWGDGRVVQPGGDVSTVLQAVVQGPDGRYYNIPTVWNGAALPVDAAERQARLAGMGNWPAYATPQEADARYMAMHGLMERDTAAWLAQNPNADPLAALMMRQDGQQHPVLQMLERLRQQQAVPGRQGQAEPPADPTKLAGDLLGFGGAAGDQTGVAYPGMPALPWMKLQGLDPSKRGYDFPADVPVMRMKRTYPQTPANEANISPDLLRLLLQPPVA